MRSQRPGRQSSVRAMYGAMYGAARDATSAAMRGAMRGTSGRPVALALSLLATGAGAACAGHKAVAAGGAAAPTGAPGRLDAAATTAGSVARIYQSMGLIAAPEPVPFVGGVAYLATARPESTLAVVSISLPNSALTFVREGERYRGTYDVRLDVRQGAQTVRHAEASEVVRVVSFKETTRGDESILFQQIVTLAPGQYNLDLAVRDAGSAKSATAGSMMIVPRFAGGALSSAVAVYEAAPRSRTDSLPRFVPSPRSTVAFGRDSVVPIYLEGYAAAAAAPGAAPGAAPSAAAGARLPLTLTVRGERGLPLWSDTASLARRTGGLFSGVVNVPVSRVGVGVATLVAARADTRDTALAPLFVSFGENLPVASFEEMISYLRFFTTSQRLKALRDTAPEFRAAAWAAFVRETDPNTATPQNEALSDYFERLRQANARFRDEGAAGWLSDRGRVYVTLGEPDQVYEQGTNEVSQRGRAQIWEYSQYRVQLVFIDQTGFSRWRLTTTSAAEFEALARRLQNRG